MSVGPAQHYLDIVKRDGETLKVLATASRTKGHDASDWVITIHFYILCLYVKALGICHNENFQEHFAIKQWLNTNPDTLVITKGYRKVEEWSRDARYEGRLFSDNEFKRFQRWFVEVRDHLVRLLKGHGLEPQVVQPVSP